MTREPTLRVATSQPPVSQYLKSCIFSPCSGGNGWGTCVGNVPAGKSNITTLRAFQFTCENHFPRSPGPKKQRGGIFGEFALSNVEGYVTSISYIYSLPPFFPTCASIMPMSLHVFMMPDGEHGTGWVRIPSRAVLLFSLAYHFDANLKIVDMHATQPGDDLKRCKHRVGQKGERNQTGCRARCSRTCHTYV